MKKLLCLFLAIVTLCFALVSCGPGGDTNMHMIMQAICKDGTIASDGQADVYYYASSNAEYSRELNEDYNSVKAYANGTGYYQHRIDFSMTYIDVTKDTSKTYIAAGFSWSADDDTITVSFSSYDYYLWDAAQSKWVYETSVSDGRVSFDMNVYYEKGEYKGTDATHDLPDYKLSDVGENLDMMLNDIAAALTLSLNGLNTIYTPKGLPIR